MKCAARSLEAWILMRIFAYRYWILPRWLLFACNPEDFWWLKAAQKLILTAGLLGYLEIPNISRGSVWRLKPDHNCLKNTPQLQVPFIFFPTKTKAGVPCTDGCCDLSLDASQENIDERVLEVTACHCCHYCDASVTSIRRLKLSPLKDRGRNTKREKCN